MNESDRYKLLKEKAKARSKELFKPIPDDILKELESESTLGSPENLIQKDNQDE